MEQELPMVNSFIHVVNGFFCSSALADASPTSSQISLDSFFFSIVFFLVACGTILSLARKSASKQDYAVIPRKKILNACCAFSFLIGAFAVQVAASALYSALLGLSFGGIALGIVVITWALLVLSSGINAYYKKSWASIGAAVTGIIVTLLAVVNVFGVLEYSKFASMSLSMEALPSNFFPILGAVSALTSTGAIAAYLPRKLSVSIDRGSLTLQVGQSQKVTAKASGGRGTHHYKWCLNNPSFEKEASNASPVSVLLHGSNVESNDVHLVVTDSSGASSVSFLLYGSNKGSTEVYVVVTDSSSPPVSVKSKTVTVNVVPGPLAAPVVYASPAEIDAGQSSLLSQSKDAFGGIEPYSYQWFEKDDSGSFVAISGATKKSCLVKTEATEGLVRKSFRLQVTDSASTTIVSNVVFLKVNSAPTVSLSPSSITLEAGQSSRFIAYVAGGTAAYEYEWFTDGKAVSGVSGSSFNFSSSTLGSHEVYVVVTDSASPPLSAKSEVATVAVVPIPLAAPVVYVSPAEIDAGQSSLLSQSKDAFGGIEPYSYQWFEKDDSGSFVAIKGASEKFYRFETDAASALGSKSFRLQVTDSAGSAVISNAVSIKVNSALTVGITPKKVTIDINQSQLFTAVASGGTGNYEYQWFVNDLHVGSNIATFFFSSSSTGLSKVFVKLTDSALRPMTVESNVCSVWSLYLPKTSGDITKWLHEGDWDKVLGVDLLDFSENVKSEHDYLAQLEDLRDRREDWFEKNGMSQGNELAALSDAYNALQSGRRNRLYVKRIAEEILAEWKLTQPEDSETAKKCMDSILHSFENELDKPWKNPKITELKKSICERMLEQSSLEIGSWLSKTNRLRESIYFLEDAVRRAKSSPEQTKNIISANRWLGTTLSKLERYWEAVPYLKEVVNLCSQPEDYQWLIETLMAKKEWQEARRYSEKFGLEIHFSTARDYYNHAVILAYLNENWKALEFAQEAVKYAQQKPEPFPDEKTCKELVDTLTRLIHSGRSY